MEKIARPAFKSFFRSCIHCPNWTALGARFLWLLWERARSEWVTRFCTYERGGKSALLTIKRAFWLNKARFLLNKARFWLNKARFRLEKARVLLNKAHFRPEKARFWLNEARLRLDGARCLDLKELSILNFQLHACRIHMNPDSFLVGLQHCCQQHPNTSAIRQSIDIKLIS